MNCEQVKELLSPYLDHALAEEERRTVAAHLETCPECKLLLIDFRRFDTLLSQLPRVSPGASLREKIFSSPEYLELTGATRATSKGTNPTIQQKSVRSNVSHQGQPPQLVALPGGRQQTRQQGSSSSSHDPRRDFFTPPDKTQRKKTGQVRWGQRVLQVALVASVLLVLGVGSLIGWNLWQRQNSLATNTTNIQPPAGLQQGPIPAGIRFLFLRNGALWSAPTDGTTGIARLTPQNTTVGAHWAVRPAEAGRSAGNMVAYVDLQHALVHLVRSDSQNDTAIQQPLLKQGVQLATVWNTSAGATILNSLTWSNDGSMLAFVADPTGTGQPGLYIYTVSTNSILPVALPVTGSISHLAWSPNSIRIAVVATLNTTSTILDYNTQSHGILTLQTGVNTQANNGDSVISLHWSPDTNAPALTWSLGQPGLVHSIWFQRVGMGGTVKPLLLTSGTYTQAEYSQTGYNGTGGWLLVANNAGTPGDITSVDLAANATRLTTGRQVQSAQWSPDGNTIAYLNAVTNGTGALYTVNVNTATDTLIASGITTTPLPAWSADSQHLVYSKGTQALIVDLHAAGQQKALKIQGTPTAFSWSPATPSQLILSTGDGQKGIYLIDIQHGTTLQIDRQALQDSVVWTQIP